MRIVICDDDKQTLNFIKRVVIEYFRERKVDVPQICTFDSGDSLLEDKGKKDIAFLDIEMPGRDGICTGKKLLEQNKNIILIIITSFSEYLDDAMRIKVFRYISKPIDPKRVKRNISDAIAAYNIINVKDVVVETSQGMLALKSSDILMLEMIGRKVHIHTNEGEYISTKSLEEWKKTLPESSFCQCHRSFIVNLFHVKRIMSDKICMDKEGLEAYLTKRKHSEIKRIWMLFLEASQ